MHKQYSKDSSVTKSHPIAYKIDWYHVRLKLRKMDVFIGMIGRLYEILRFRCGMDKV
jgi:hypothetical protein